MNLDFNQVFNTKKPLRHPQRFFFCRAVGTFDLIKWKAEIDFL